MSSSMLVDAPYLVYFEGHEFIEEDVLQVAGECLHVDRQVICISDSVGNVCRYDVKKSISAGSKKQKKRQFLLMGV